MGLLAAAILMADERQAWIGKSKFAAGASTQSSQTVGESTEITGVMAPRHVAAFARSLYSNYGLAIQIAGIILLVALVGAAVIVGRATGFVYQLGGGSEPAKTEEMQTG